MWYGKITQSFIYAMMCIVVRIALGNKHTRTESEREKKGPVRNSEIRTV